MSDVPEMPNYRGTGCYGERATLGRAMCRALAEKGLGLDIGMGAYEYAVDCVLQAQAAYVSEKFELVRQQQIDTALTAPASASERGS